MLTAFAGCIYCGAQVRLISLAGTNLSDASIQQDIAYKVGSQEERNEDGEALSPMIPMLQLL